MPPPPTPYLAQPITILGQSNKRPSTLPIFPPEDISVSGLDIYLARFFLFARPKKKQQSEYEPDTLRCILASISRHLQEKKQINIIKDNAFKHCKDVFQSKIKELKSKGLGNNQKKTRRLISLHRRK